MNKPIVIRTVERIAAAGRARISRRLACAVPALSMVNAISKPRVRHHLVWGVSTAVPAGHRHAIGKWEATGLLTLAISPGGHSLVGAGDYQAEYQGWLCESGDDVFIDCALQAMSKRFRGMDIVFTYFLPNAPVPAVLRTGALRHRAR